ncbi:hypothetical protein VPH35_043868 [Triticum aestivum]
MAMEEHPGDGLEFLSDPMDSQILRPTIFRPYGDTETILTQSAAESSMGDVGDTPLALQLATTSNCDAMSLSAAHSHESAPRGGSEGPKWTKRVHVGRTPIERPPCPNRVCALEKTLRLYAEKKNGTVVVPVVGNNFDSLGEAYDYYNLYSWEIGFGIRYGKSRLNVERTKCMQEIVCGCSVSPT